VQEISRHVSTIKKSSNNLLSEVMQPISDPNRPEQNLSDNEADEVPDEDDFLDENGAQSASKAYRTS
jgi:hypothetical protein